MLPPRYKPHITNQGQFFENAFHIGQSFKLNKMIAERPAELMKSSVLIINF